MVGVFFGGGEVLNLGGAEQLGEDVGAWGGGCADDEVGGGAGGGGGFCEC